MLNIVKKVVVNSTENIFKKFKIRAIVKNTTHFQERLIERFNKEDIPQLERAIEKAFEKATPNNKTFRYTHPAYDVTVVVKKLGTNCLELVTCWKKQKGEITYV